MNTAKGVNTLPQTYKDFNQWQVGLTFAMPIGFRAPLANTRQAQYQLLRQRAFLQQIVHQTTHSLARFFLEVDANYKQFRTAQRLRAAAQQRLEAQRAFYEEGRITIDRLLDAVSQYANAIAQEAQYKTSYNTSIAALEEAKGTLLAYDNIAVAEGPSPRKAYIQARDQRAAHGQFHVPLDGSYRPQPINGPPLPDSLPANPPPELGQRRPQGRVPGSGRPLRPTRRRRRPRPSRPASPTSSRRSRGLPPLPTDPGVARTAGTAPQSRGRGNQGPPADEPPALARRVVTCLPCPRATDEDNRKNQAARAGLGSTRAGPVSLNRSLGDGHDRTRFAGRNDSRRPGSKLIDASQGFPEGRVARERLEGPA